MSDRATNPMHRIADALERIATALEVPQGPQMCELPSQAHDRMDDDGGAPRCLCTAFLPDPECPVHRSGK